MKHYSRSPTVLLQESLLCLVGGVLFLAAGSSCLHHNLGEAGDRFSLAMALGSLALITGLVLLVDCVQVVTGGVRQKKEQGR